MYMLIASIAVKHLMSDVLAKMKISSTVDSAAQKFEVIVCGKCRHYSLYWRKEVATV